MLEAWRGHHEISFNFAIRCGTHDTMLPALTQDFHLDDMCKEFRLVHKGRDAADPTKFFNYDVTASGERWKKNDDMVDLTKEVCLYCLPLGVLTLLAQQLEDPGMVLMTGKDEPYTGRRGPKAPVLVMAWLADPLYQGKQMQPFAPGADHAGEYPIVLLAAWPPNMLLMSGKMASLAPHDVVHHNGAPPLGKKPRRPAAAGPDDEDD